MYIINKIILLLILSFSVSVYASEEDTEAVALSSGHQAGLTKGDSINNPPEAPFGGYSNTRRSDKERAEELLNEIRGVKKAASSQNKSTD